MATKIKLPALLLAVLVTIGVSPAQAQEEAADGEQGSRFADVETSRVRPMSQSTGRALEPVREFLSPTPEEEGDPVPEPNPAAALEELRDININRLPPHEQAEINFYFGYAHYMLENMQQVQNYWQQVIDQEEANLPLRVRTMKTLAQVYYIEEQYSQALDLYLEWMSYQEIIAAGDYALVGNIYYTMDDHVNALENLERAISLREANGEIGQENWYAIQRSIYYSRGDYNTVISILEKLVVYYPNVRYWRELGSMFAELERERDQMIAYDLAWLQDGLTSESMVRGLAYMYVAAGAPLQAAEIVVKGIQDGLVEETEENLLSIGQFYYTARALDEATTWTERAAARAETGDTYAWLTNIYIEAARYEEAYEAASEALEIGGLDEPDQVRLQAGNALFSMYRYEDALSQFRAVRSERYRENAQTWIRYVENESNKDRQIRNTGIDLDAIREDVYSQL